MKAIIVGAGVLGTSIAFQLAKRGVEVTVLDKSNPGHGASAASFAWLNSHNKKLRPYHDLNVISMGEWHAVARELGSSAWLRPDGNVHVAGTAADAEVLTERVQRLQSYGYPAVPMAPSELSHLDPAIRVRAEYVSAAFFPSEGWIAVPLLISELLRAGKRLGVTLRHSTNVVGLAVEGGAVKGVLLDGGERLDADVVVVAAGAGIGSLLGTQGIEVRTEGTPGVSVCTSPGATRLSTMLHVPGLSVRPDSDGRVVVRSKDIDGRIDRDSWSLPQDALRDLFELTSTMVEDFDPAFVRAERVQIAARPYPFDGLPAVGYWGDLENLYVTTTHSGVTLGAIIGRLAAEEITTGEQAPLLEGFRPSRVIEAAKNDVGYFDPYAIEGEKLAASS